MLTFPTPAISQVADSLPRSGMAAHAPALRGHIMDWAVQAGVQGTDLARWATARYERLLCRLYPHADLPALRAVADVVLWLFLADGYLGPGGAGDDPAYSDLFARTTAAIMAGAGPVQPPADPLLRCTWELARNPALPRSPWWRSRLHGDLAEFAAALHGEVEDRAGRLVPSIGEYIDRRRVTWGWDILADFGEAALKAPGPAESAGYGRLRLAGGDIAFAVNDILALAGEPDAGQSRNLVLIVQQARGGPVEAAVGWVDRWILSRLDDYLAARAGLLAAGEADGRGAPGGFRPAREHGLSAAGLVPALDAVVRGTLDWSLETPARRRK